MENSENLTEFSISCADTTSPSQLEDVTLGADTTTFGNSLGMTAAHRGRSVKEFEEQLILLRKENFNLKLRIYFLEERMGCNFNLDKESAVKKNVELMVEVESLRKELQEKQDLLCQAVKAMELEEEEHKKELQQKDDQMLRFQEQLEELQLKLQEAKYDMEAFTDPDCNSQFLKELENKICVLEEELSKEKENSASLENQLRLASFASVRCRNLEEENKQKEEKINELHRDIHEMAKKFSTCNLRMQSLEDELQTRNSDLTHNSAGLLGEFSGVDFCEQTENESVSVCSQKSTPLNSSNNNKQLTPSPSPRKPNKSSTSYPPESGEAVAATKNLMDEVKKYKEELSAQEQKILKLKSEQFKACQIIKSMINSRGDNEKECTKLREQIELLEKENDKLRGKDEMPAHRTKSLHEKISEMNFTANVGPEAEKERSAVEPSDCSELAEKYKQLTVELENQIQVLKDTLKEKDSQMNRLKHDYEAIIKNVKEKDNQIVDLEFELLATSKSNHSINSEKTDNDNEKPTSFFLKEIEEKDREIERLESELRKRTCDLQGILTMISLFFCHSSLLTKELWEKNKEIERLQRRYGALLEKKDSEIGALESDVSGKDLQLSILKDKISELGMHVNMPSNLMSTVSVSETEVVPEEIAMLPLQEQLRACLRERKYFLAQIDELRLRIKNTAEQENGPPQHDDDLEMRLRTSEKLRKESTEICNVLSVRLQELAQFLQSLLQEKSVLGFLGYTRNLKLQRIITQSLDLSRTVNVSVTQYPDQSLLQLTDISELLNSTRADNVNLSDCFKDRDENLMFSIIPTNLTLTYQSHLQTTSENDYKNESRTEIINVLRKQVENLKHEVELRDHELNKLTSSSKNVTNDEEFVDFLVDINAPITNTLPKEKIMEELLADKNKLMNKTSSSVKQRAENQSESESWSEPDRAVSKTRIGLDDDSLKPASNASRLSRGASSTTESTEEDGETSKLTRTMSKIQLLAENRQTIILLHEQVCELEKKLTEKEKELKELQTAHYETESAMKKERVGSAEERKQLEVVLVEAQRNQRVAEKKVEELQRIVSNLQEQQKELQESTESKNKMLVNKINELESEKMKAEEAATNAEKAADLANKELESAEIRIKNLKSESEQEIMNLREEFARKIDLMERKAEIEINNANTVMRELQATYEKDFMKKSDVEKRLLELEILSTELENSKKLLKKSEQDETDLKRKLCNTEHFYNDKINKLHADLDTATLQYSEAVLEKTKLWNEKSVLEHRVKDNDSNRAVLEKQVDDFQKELADVKDVLNKNLLLVETQKSKLQLRVMQLEAANAELQGKLLKLQAGRSDQVLSASLPTSPNRLLDLCQLRSGFPYVRQFSDNSGYNSEEQHLDEGCRGAVQRGGSMRMEVERHEGNSSPDLGIESDQGRFSSLEATVPRRPMLLTLELTESMNNLLDGEGARIEEIKCNNEICTKRWLEMTGEINDLKRHLLRTRRALEETMTRLALSNKRKVQVEKTICKQIHKTSQVLWKVKANLDSGSEPDVCKK